MIPRRSVPAVSPAGVAAYVVLAPLSWLALSHHVLWRGAGAYLFHDIAASKLVCASLFVATAAIGALFAVVRKPAVQVVHVLVLAHATLAALAQVGAFYCFANAAYFSVFAPTIAISMGLVSGAILAASPALISRAARERAVLGVLSVEVLAPALGVIVVLLGIAHRAGPLRVGIALASISASLVSIGAASTISVRRTTLRVQLASAVVATSIALLLPFVQPLVPSWEVALAPDPVVLSAASPAGRVTLTSGRGAFQLFTDGTLRASSIDGYRFRESLVHPLLASLSKRERVLVIGGGDGQAVRELLRYPEVHEIVVVEPLGALVNLAKTQPFLLSENHHSLDDPRVFSIVADPIVWLRDNDRSFDAIVIDLGEPAGPTRGKLFTTYFFRLAAKHLSEGGAGVLATVSPMANRKAFWSIVSSLDEAGLATTPFRADIPTFGVVGFVLFGRHEIAPAHPLPKGLSYLDEPQLAQMLRLAPDESRIDAEPNRLYHQVFLKYRAE